MVEMALRVDRTRLALSVAFAAGLALILLGFSVAQTGRDAQRLPDVIASINPGPGDKVLRQSQIIVDFAEPHDAVLVLNGLELPVTRLDELAGAGAPPRPGAQLEIPPTAIYDPGNFIISFQPQEGALIESLRQGEHRAAVIYWRIDQTRNEARSFSWTFSVS
jgi:hypothetical protein